MICRSSALVAIPCAVLFLCLGCDRFAKDSEEAKEDTRQIHATGVNHTPSETTFPEHSHGLLEPRADTYIRYENPEALEEWQRRSRRKYLLLGSSEFGVGVNLYINPGNIKVDRGKDWDELAGLVLWDFAPVKEPGDVIPCYGGEVRFKRRIGSQLVYVDDEYIGGEDDWIVNEFEFSNEFAYIDGVIALAYEGGDVYFDRIISDYSDEQVLRWLALMSLPKVEEFGIRISQQTKRQLGYIR